MESPTDIVVLTDEQVQGLMTPEESLSILEKAFRYLATGKGVTRPRSRTYVGTRQPGRAPVRSPASGQRPPDI